MSRRGAPQFGSRGRAPLFTAAAVSTDFPTAITGLTLRMHAEMGTTSAAGLVSAWADQSATAANFTAAGTARPLLVAAAQNGRSILRFDGTSDIMASVTTLGTIITASAYTIVAAWKNSSVRAAAAAGYDEPALIGDTGSYFTSPFGNSTQIGSAFYGGGDRINRVATATGTFRHTETILSTAAGGTLSTQVGTAGTPTTSAGVTTVGVTTGTLKLGCNYSTIFLGADVGEILVYNRTLTGGELAQLRAYMISQWGVS